jgi:hypothetical protein
MVSITQMQDLIHAGAMAIGIQTVTASFFAKHPGRHRQLVVSGKLNLRPRQWLKEFYCRPTLQISAQILNLWVLETWCSAAVT